MLDAASPTWSVQRAVIPGRIVVVSGDAPKVGESAARYLLAVLLALVWNAVLKREQPSKTFLVLDEAQWYAHDSMAEMLRLGRRFNFHVWTVTQSLRSLPEPVRDAFLTNSADVVLFRGDPLDVREVSRWAAQIAPERIMRMPRGEAAVLIDKGSETHWIRLPPPTRGASDPNRFRPVTPMAITVEDPDPQSPPIDVPPSLEPSPKRPTVPGQIAPLIGALTELVGRGNGDSEITVRLAELRKCCSTDPESADRAVRNGGRFLSSTGAILRSGRDVTGSFWVLSRSRLSELLAIPSGPMVPPAEKGVGGSAECGHVDAS
jgi:hypothetical protein